VPPRNFRGTIRQESIAPSAPGGRTSARRMWSRDRREEFNSRPSIADTVDYNLKARSSGLRHDTRLADCGPAPVTAQTPCGRRLFDLHLRKSTLSRGEPCPGWLRSLRLRWSNTAFSRSKPRTLQSRLCAGSGKSASSEPRVFVLDLLPNGSIPIGGAKDIDCGNAHGL